MNYKRIYDSLIQKAYLENRRKGIDKYYEKHHIIPKCLNGDNSQSNLILLTAREHYFAHKLLVFIYPNNHSLIRALSIMVYMNKRKYKTDPRDYDLIAKLYKKSPMPKETRLKISKSNKGKKFPAEFGIKISKSLKKSGVCSGKNNGMYGRKHSVEAIEKMKNRKFNKKTRKLMSQNHANVSGMNNPMAGLFGEDNPNFIKINIKEICKLINISKNLTEVANYLNLNIHTLRGKLKREYNTNFSKIKKGEFNPLF